MRVDPKTVKIGDLLEVEFDFSDLDEDDREQASIYGAGIPGLRGFDVVDKPCKWVVKKIYPYDIGRVPSEFQCIPEGYPHEAATFFILAKEVVRIVIRTKRSVL